MITRRATLKTITGALIAPAVVAAPGVLRAADAVRVGAIKVPHWAAVWEIGSYIPKGHAVELIEFKTSLEMIAALTAGSLDIATIGYWHAIRMLDQGADIQALAGICSGGSRVVVRRDVTINGWKELRGKTCSVGRGSTQDLQFLLAIKNNGLAMKDIEYRDLGGNMAVHTSALQQKQIDVASMWEPFASQVIESGLATELPGLYENSFSANAIMVTMAATADKKRDQVRAVVMAHAKSTDDFAKDPERYLQRAVKLSGFSRETMVMANKNTALEYLLRMSDARKIAAVAHDFAYARSNVEPKLSKAFNYSFLEEATGKKAAELGA